MSSLTLPLALGATLGPGESRAFAQAVATQPGASAKADAAVPAAPKAPAAPGAVIPADGQPYRISRFEARYEQQAKGQTPLDAVLSKTRIVLGKTPQGYVQWRVGLERVAVDLSAVKTETVFYSSALGSMTRQLVEALKESGMAAVIVGIDQKDIDADGKDVRPAGQRTLRLVVLTGVVRELRTVASGERVDSQDRVNSDKHARLRAHSPIQAGQVVDAKVMDDYLARLNRHPGRRVDAAISRAQTGQPGDTALDFLVAENKPWTLFAQVANTGTPSTHVWRERFGFQSTQLTGHDDILNLEYTTGGFESLHNFRGSYDAPVFDADRLRWRIGGGWNTYDASVLGQSVSFEGEGFFANGELVANIWQHRKTFLDLFAGARYEGFEVSNTVGGGTVEGSENFFIPRAGVALSRVTDTMATAASFDTEWSVPSIAGTSDQTADLNALGRPNAQNDWVVLHWNATQSVFLEPIFDPAGWADPNSDSATLAHEVQLTFSGQNALGNRMIAQEMGVAGGLYTVRGYPEYIVAGDTTYLFRAEYLFHVPRMFSRQPKPGTLFGQPFRAAPQQAYGRPDWDLILRTFIDLADVENSQRNPNIEANSLLVGTGAGVEVLFKQNVSLRMDWGVALRGVEDATGRDLVTPGSNRLHLAFTFLY